MFFLIKSIDLPIRFKLIFSYCISFVVLVSIASTVIYGINKRIIENNLEKEAVFSSIFPLDYYKTTNYKMINGTPTLNQDQQIPSDPNYNADIFCKLKYLLTINIIFFIFFCSVVLFVICLINNITILQPIKYLSNNFSETLFCDFLHPNQKFPKNEIHRLNYYFARIVDTLNNFNDNLLESKDKYKSMIEGVVEGIFQSTAGGKMIEASPSMARLLGYDSISHLLELDDIGLHIYENPLDRMKMLNFIAAQRAISNFEVEFRKKNGESIWVSMNARAIFNSDGSIKYIEGFVTDITAKKNTENELIKAKSELEQKVLKRTEELSRSIGILERKNFEVKKLHEVSELLQACKTMSETFDVLPYFINALFPDTTGSISLVSEVNKSFETALQWGEKEYYDVKTDDCWALKLGKSYCSVPAGTHPCCNHVKDKKSSTLCVPILTQGGLTGLFHLCYKTKYAEEICQLSEAESYLVVIRTLVENYCLVISNLKLKENLLCESIKDSLTGLFNRRYMNEYIYRELHRHKRKKLPLVLMIIDIDHFKNINDTHGHLVGDEILTSLALIWRESVRMEDVICRFGGEEFVVVMPEANIENGSNKAEYLRNKIASKAIKTSFADINVTISIGVAVFPDNGLTVEKLIAEADHALYVAKTCGRNRIVTANSCHVIKKIA